MIICRGVGKYKTASEQSIHEVNVLEAGKIDNNEDQKPNCNSQTIPGMQSLVPTQRASTVQSHFGNTKRTYTILGRWF